MQKIWGGIRRLLLAVLLAVLLYTPTTQAHGSSITITDRGVTIRFPDSVTFSAHVQSPAGISRAILEYGVEQQTCATVSAKAFPPVTGGSVADLRWTWDMRESGSEPPGATIWYRWRIIDKAGAEQVSPTRRVTWIDTQHSWTSISRAGLTLHWYGGTQAFAEDLLNSAVGSLQHLEQTTGVASRDPINLYIYADSAALQNAVLYQPGWTGGLAFPAYNLVSIGISQDQLDWGKRAEAHELTHVLVGHLTFSCLSSVPTWLNEGIAVYGEGGLDSPSQTQLQTAITLNTLLSIHLLSGAFSEIQNRADLSYSESYSLVNFLVTSYHQDKLHALFGELSQGTQIEDALHAVYGFGLDGLEDLWRASIGAQPRQAAGVAPVATSLPTPIPTYPPLTSMALAPPGDSSPALTAEPIFWLALALAILALLLILTAGWQLVHGKKTL